MTVLTSTVSAVVMNTTIAQQLLVTKTEFLNPFKTEINSVGMSTKVVNNSVVDKVLPTVASFTTNVTTPDELNLVTLVGNSVGAPAIEPCLFVDPSMPIAYAGYALKIKKLDYTAGWPPVVTTAVTTDIQNDWVVRDTLPYS